MLDLLDEVRSKKPRSKRESLKAMYRDWRNKDRKSDLELKLNACTQLLNLQLTNLMRSEFLHRLDKISRHGRLAADDLKALSESVETLRLGSTASFITSDALEQIRSVVQVSEETVLRIRQARVLNGLRFEMMDERFHDIEEAHKDTFRWILEGEDGYGTPSNPSIAESSEDETCEHATKDTARDGRSHSYSPGGDDDPDSRPSLDDESETESPLTHEPTGPSATITSDNGSNTSLITIQYSEPKSEACSEGELSLLPTTSALPSSRLPPPSVPSGNPLQWPTRGRFLDARSQEARQKFTTWLAHKNGIFHISGKPGSGKSTLMKFICQHPRTLEYSRAWAGDKKLAFGRFFFWKPGTSYQKSTKGLIRGLLHCCLSSCPELIPFAFPELWESSRFSETIHVDNSDCLRAFESLTCMQAVQTEHKMMFFIDGLDEFEGDHVTLVRMLFDWTTRTQDVKICVSSREWPVFSERFGACPKLCLQDLTLFDIQQFARDRIQQMDFSGFRVDPQQDTSTIARRLEVAITTNADGVFLWVSLVLRHIEMGIEEGDNVNDLEEKIRRLPTDLEPLLKVLLTSIPKASRKLAYAMLRLAMRITRMTDENLHLMQLSFLEEYVQDQDFAFKLACTHLSPFETTQRLKRAHKRVYGLCKGLLELRAPMPSTRRRLLETYEVMGPLVLLTHRSVVEFLEDDYFKTDLYRYLPNWCDFDAYCQSYLGLIRQVKLPRYHFVPHPRVVDHRFSQFLDLLPHTILLGRLMGDPSPSFRNFLIRALKVYTTSSDSALEQRFQQANHAIRHTLLAHGFGGTSTSIVLGISSGLLSFRCSLTSMTSMLSGVFGFSKWVDANNMDIGCLTECYYVCLTLISINFLPLPDYRGDVPRYIRERLSRCIEYVRTIQAFVKVGACVDFYLAGSEMLAFHAFLAQMWDRTPKLTFIAIMLYHGADPGFAIDFENPESISPTDLAGAASKSKGTAYIKGHFRNATHNTDRRAAGRVRIPDIARPRLPWRRPRVEATPENVEILTKHNYTLDLRVLVDIWFPEYAGTLLEVMKWILDLGVPVEPHHREELQARFGAALRPLFDPSEAGFVGFIKPKNPFHRPDPEDWRWE
ncbi:hypothetical protein F4780DRAFT_397335 [Xylariomycetidae sp. FL0641]|nr:hypothetical protein F4780DRAFT_397335 [Xylariomycetidae sp. FL0641]